MRELASFQNIHKGKTILVCGCGESLNDLARPDQWITIGVNDVGRRFQPTYLVVANWRHQFRGDRFHYVETSRAQYVFTHLPTLELPHPNVVRFRHGTENGTNFTDPNVLHYSNTSVYMALCLAVHMGASRIGLIGVDLTDNHFFARTGKHPLSPYADVIDAQFRHLNASLVGRGVKVVNLSRTSRLTAFPRMDQHSLAELSRLQEDMTRDDAPGDFGGGGEGFIPSHPLRIVSYSHTPVVGVPAALARCIHACTPHYARAVVARNDYGDAMSFQGDIAWTAEPKAADAELAAADVVIIHNGHVHPAHRPLLAGKALVTMAHNYIAGVNTEFVEQGYPGVVCGQYQATLPEFRNWWIVPNPVPLWEPAYAMGPKNETLTICYLPSNQYDAFPQGHPIFWHSKGYASTMQALDRLAARLPLELVVVRQGRVSHEDALWGRRRAQIVIDECVTGSYHRASLEGLALGCVVVNGVGMRPGVLDALRYCACGEHANPFIYSRLDSLEGILTTLLRRGPDLLGEEGYANHLWMQRHWRFAQQWTRHWLPPIRQALQYERNRS